MVLTKPYPLADGANVNSPVQVEKWKHVLCFDCGMSPTEPHGLMGLSILSTSGGAGLRVMKAFGLGLSWRTKGTSGGLALLPDLPRCGKHAPTFLGSQTFSTSHDSPLHSPVKGLSHLHLGNIRKWGLEK